ncbi:MAG TPA: hypothetical protein VF911_16410 [Thermoanaerobaculia bacterium]
MLEGVARAAANGRTSSACAERHRNGNGADSGNDDHVERLV